MHPSVLRKSWFLSVTTYCFFYFKKLGLIKVSKSRGLRPSTTKLELLMRKSHCQLLVVACLLGYNAISQVTGKTDTIPAIWLLDMKPRERLSSDSSTWIVSGLCKTLKITKKPINAPAFGNGKSKTSFLTVHGNIQYDYLYRTLVDTPFYQKDFSQHTVKTNFNFVIKNAYPVQVTLLHRNSNSPYFRDITDVAIQFSQRDYLSGLRENLLEQSIQKLDASFKNKLKDLENKYQGKLAEVTALQKWLASPARIRELVAERERLIKKFPQYNVDSLLHGSVPIPGIVQEKLDSIKGLVPANIPDKLKLPDEESLKKAASDYAKKRADAFSDSVIAQAEAWAKEKKQRLQDSLSNTKTAAWIEKQKKALSDARKELAGLEKRWKGARKELADSLQRIKQEIMRIKDVAAIRQYIDQKKLSVKQLPAGWKTLASIRSVGIGRTWLDYSDLTVKDISLTGANVEVNPGNFYFAAAGGRVNYRFRDFVVHNGNTQPKQSLFMLRAGLGKKDGNNFILSWFDGKRNLLTPPASGTNIIRPERVIGLSAQTRIKINDNQYVIAEFGKSSFHNTGNVNAGNSALFDKVKNFKDHSNEAYSIRLYSYWPQAGVKFSGYYKKTGEHFQSFNLQPVNSVQEAFQVKLQKTFWKKRLVLDAGLRKK